MAFNAYMHERNIYKNQPNFKQIALDFPEFRKYLIPDAKGQKVRVDFTNTDALRMLTKILLKKDFDLDVEIPQGFLIPTIPQRLNYILWLEDLLSNSSTQKENITGIDIGTGPCAIFSLLGAQKNGWKFIATESSDDAILWAEKNISANSLEKNITVVKVSEGSTLSEILSTNNEKYDFCLCNPPFFENIEEIRNKHRNSNETIADVAQKGEIFVKGGELDFVKNILKDSLIYKDRISSSLDGDVIMIKLLNSTGPHVITSRHIFFDLTDLFTSMFGKKKSLLQIVKEVEEIEGIKFTTTEFCQGNTVRWGIAWTFDESVHLQQQVKKKIKPQKAKPPLEYQIPLPKSANVTVETVVKQTESFLKVLQIPVTVTKKSTNFTELLLKSDKNTWSHQRRKRRELERQKKLGEKLGSVHLGVDQISCKGCNTAENVSSPVVANGSLEINSPVDMKDCRKLENIHTCIKKEALVKDCSMEIQTVTSQSDCIVPSEALPSENSELEFSTNTKLLQNNKRKRDFISEELPSNKKNRPNEEKITNHITNSSENSNLDLKDVCNVDIKPIKMDTFVNCDITDTQNAILEDRKLDACLNMASKSDSVKSESQIHNTGCHSEEEIHDQNPTTSSTCKNINPSAESNNEVSLSDKKFDVNSTAENSQISDVLMETENSSPEQGLILHCHLQFIKGKRKIYVKMNCPPAADRNIMHQVFQLIKNKIK